MSDKPQEKDRPTAGFRNAGWTMTSLPSDVKVSVHPLQTSDGAAVNGFLYAGARTDTVLCIMHPREFLATHYLIPEILQCGVEGEPAGIDGIGLLQVNRLVTLRVLFQCKRYEGTVSPSQVRDFRGAMMGRSEHGIIITTGSYTSEAQREASRDGVPPIELIDAERIVEMCQDVKLGLRPVQTYEVDSRFFDEFE